jgi:hypothetical protein
VVKLYTAMEVMNKMKMLTYQQKILDELKDLPEEQIPNLIKMIRIFKESLMKQKNAFEDLKKEFKEWDKLSDEALDNFERTI